MTEIKKHKDADFSMWPAPISEELFEDWLTIRKAKKKPLTQRAINNLKGHLMDLYFRHRVTPEMAFHICVDKGWQSLKYAWIVKEIKEDILSSGFAGCMISDIDGFNQVDLNSILTFNEYQR